MLHRSRSREKNCSNDDATFNKIKNISISSLSKWKVSYQNNSQVKEERNTFKTNSCKFQYEFNQDQTVLSRRLWNNSRKVKTTGKAAIPLKNYCLTILFARRIICHILLVHCRLVQIVRGKRGLS